MEDFQKMDVLSRLNEIEQRLKQDDPNLGIHLESIKNSLQKYEELVHMLTDEQIGIYMAGMQKYKNIQLVNEASRARGPRGKKGTSIEDF